MCLKWAWVGDPCLWRVEACSCRHDGSGRGRGGVSHKYGGNLMRCLWFNISSFLCFVFFLLMGWKWELWRGLMWLTIRWLKGFFGGAEGSSVRSAAAGPELKSEAVCFQNDLWSVISLQCWTWNRWKECAVFWFFILNISFYLLLWCLVVLTPLMLPIWITLRCL